MTMVSISAKSLTRCPTCRANVYCNIYPFTIINTFNYKTTIYFKQVYKILSKSRNILYYHSEITTLFKNNMLDINDKYHLNHI